MRKKCRRANLGAESARIGRDGQPCTTLTYHPPPQCNHTTIPHHLERPAPTSTTLQYPTPSPTPPPQPLHPLLHHRHPPPSSHLPTSPHPHPRTPTLRPRSQTPPSAPISCGSRAHGAYTRSCLEFEIWSGLLAGRDRDYAGGMVRGALWEDIEVFCRIRGWFLGAVVGI